MRSTSVYSCSHTDNHFYIAFVILLLNYLEYVIVTKYFATDYLVLIGSFLLHNKQNGGWQQKQSQILSEFHIFREEITTKTGKLITQD